MNWKAEKWWQCGEECRHRSVWSIGGCNQWFIRIFMSDSVPDVWHSKIYFSLYTYLIDIATRFVVCTKKLQFTRVTKIKYAGIVFRPCPLWINYKKLCQKSLFRRMIQQNYYFTEKTKNRLHKKLIALNPMFFFYVAAQCTPSASKAEYEIWNQLTISHSPNKIFVYIREKGMNEKKMKIININILHENDDDEKKSMKIIWRRWRTREVEEHPRRHISVRFGVIVRFPFTEDESTVWRCLFSLS